MGEARVASVCFKNTTDHRVTKNCIYLSIFAQNDCAKMKVRYSRIAKLVARNERSELISLIFNAPSCEKLAFLQ